MCGIIGCGGGGGGDGQGLEKLNWLQTKRIPSKVAPKDGEPQQI